MIRIFALSFVLALAGCANFSNSMSALGGVGVLSEEKSDFDGSRSVRLTPAFLYNPNKVFGLSTKLGGFWNSGTPESVTLLLQNNSQTGYGQAFVTYEGVDINIDGEKFSYQANGGTTLDHSGYNNISKTIHTSSKSAVIIPLAVLKGMINAKDCRIRINTGKGAETAYFSVEQIPGSNNTAKFFLKAFVDKIEGRVSKPAQEYSAFDDE